MIPFIFKRKSVRRNKRKSMGGVLKKFTTSYFNDLLTEPNHSLCTLCSAGKVGLEIPLPALCGHVIDSPAVQAGQDLQELLVVEGLAHRGPQELVGFLVAELVAVAVA